LVLLAGVLVTRGYLGDAERDSFVGSAAQLVGAAVAVASLFWSQRDKKQTGELLNGALASPAGTTVHTLASSAGSGWKDLLTRQAISTVLALVGDQVSRMRFAKYLTQLRDALNAAFPPAG
jgi:hypothetical protein